MVQRRTHVGLIVPASNTVMEPDFHRALDATVAVSTWRIFLADVSRAAEERMLREELPGCLEGLAHARPRHVVFGCTSAGSLDGLEHDRELGRRIAEATGAPVTTVVGSMLPALQAAGAERVAVFTPYREELTRAVAVCIEEAGREVVRAVGMGIADNREIGAVEPDRIVAFVHDGMQGVRADAVFLSCTNWRAVEAIEPLADELGVPVLSSNQVTLEAVRRALLA